MKSKSTAILLAVLLGGIGIHRFYLNRPVSGLVYMIFCWTFIPAIVSLLEAFTFLSYTEEKFNLKYADRKALVKSGNATDDLVKLSNLLEKNLITREEYEDKKSVLLKKIS